MADASREQRDHERADVVRRRMIASPHAGRQAQRTEANQPAEAVEFVCQVWLGLDADGASGEAFQRHRRIGEHLQRMEAAHRGARLGRCRECREFGRAAAVHDRGPGPPTDVATDGRDVIIWDREERKVGSLRDRAW